jgi:hypothetical protein
MHSIGPGHHLDKGVTFLQVDNACLDLAKAAENAPDLTLSATGTAYKQCATKDPDVVSWQ